MSVRELHRTQHGFGLVELMVAMVLALFLLGGLFSVVQSQRSAYRTQSGLVQLQNSERFALTILGEVGELAGYFPDPSTQLPGTVFPADALFANAGDIVAGVQGATGGTGDTVAVRFMTAPNDGLLNCSGVGNTGAVAVLYENVFSVNAQNQLVCALNGAAAVPLINGVQSLTVQYGVKTSLSSANSTFDTYKSASQLAAGDWSNVVCIKLTLTFVNPLAGSPGQPATIPVTRVIALMSRTGVNT